MPNVSVIIPVHNCERFIQEAIQSVVDQTYGDLEIIVVDDGSTDRTGSIVRQFPGPVSYHRQDNQGAGVARNSGVSLARGQWIAFLDADDVWYPSKLAVQIEHTGTHPDVDLFYSDFDLMDENGQVTQRGYWLEKLKRRGKRTGRSLVSLVFDNQPFPNPSTVLVRKDLFSRTGGFNPSFLSNYHEDFELWARMSKLTRLHFIPRSLVKYRVHPANEGAWRRNWLLLLNCLWESWRDQPERQVAFLRGYAKYFSEEGVYCYQSENYREARLYFRLAFAYQPLYWRNWYRWFLSYLPLLRSFGSTRRQESK